MWHGLRLLLLLFSYVWCGYGLEEVNGLDESRVPKAWKNAVMLRGSSAGQNFPHNRIVWSDVKQVLNKTALEIKIQWKKVPYPSPRDWIGVFACSAGEREEDCSPINRYPVQFKDVSRAQGKTELTFRVIVRPGVYGYMFAYVSPAVAPFPEVEAISSIVKVPELVLGIPSQVRLSLDVKDQTAMRFMWALSPVVGSEIDLDSLEVAIGTKPETYTTFVKAQRMYNYDAKDMCERQIMPAASIGWVSPGLQVEAIVRGLEPNTRYFYSIKNTKLNIQTPERSFLSAPKAGSPFKMVVFGDMGQSMDAIDQSREHSWDFTGRGEVPAPNSTLLVKHLLNEGATLVNHIGDLSYATGALALWDTWLTQIEPVSSSAPYMVAIGNHEMGWDKSDVPGSDSQGECGIPYSAFFPFASQIYDSYKSASPSEKPTHSKGWKAPWYSYNYGSAHITIMSTEHTFSPDSPQYKWIQNDLATVDRSITPWVIFMGHRPMYVSSSFATDHDALSVGLQRYIEPLLQSHGVSMAFWGHHHSYQRSIELAGVHHFVVGAAGFELSPVDLDGDPHFAVVNNSTWGVSAIHIVNNTFAKVEFFDNIAFKVLDSIWIHHQERPSSPYQVIQ